MDTGSSYGFTCTLQSAQSDELENKMESPIPRSPESCFDYIHFAKFLAMRRIEIIPLKDLVCLDGMDMEQSIKGGNVKLDAIGTGGTMQVVLTKWNPRVVAAKVPRDRRRGQREYKGFMYDIFFEIQIMSHKPLCDHPNIVKLLGISFNDLSEDDQFYPVLVVEAAHPPYPDLGRYVESNDCPLPIPLPFVYGLIGDIADGLTVLHSFGAFHGDIKPANILLFEGKTA
jgi:serine/threonine protein kinase